MAKFSVTYESVTEESAAHGDVEERGYIIEATDLRTAIDELNGTVIEADEYPISAPRWFTTEARQDIHTGAYESRSLHLPSNVTPSSARRVARLLGLRTAR